jgi:hypothetical protein
MENSAVRKQPTSSPKRLDHYVTTKGFSTNPMEMTHVVEDSLDFSRAMKLQNRRTVSTRT